MNARQYRNYVRRNIRQSVKRAVYSMAKRAEGEASGGSWLPSTGQLIAGGIGAVAGGGLGAALPYIFMKDKEKAKKWMLLSALLGTMVGATGGAVGYSYASPLFGSSKEESKPNPKPKPKAKSTTKNTSKTGPAPLPDWQEAILLGDYRAAQNIAPPGVDTHKIYEAVEDYRQATEDSPLIGNLPPGMLERLRTQMRYYDSPYVAPARPARAPLPAWQEAVLLGDYMAAQNIAPPGVDTYKIYEAVEDYRQATEDSPLKSRIPPEMLRVLRQQKGYGK